MYVVMDYDTINGVVGYLTSKYVWTKSLEEAHKFSTKAEAEHVILRYFNQQSHLQAIKYHG